MYILDIYILTAHIYLFTCIESTNCLHRYLLVAVTFSPTSQQKTSKQHTLNIHSTNRYVHVKIEK